MPDIKLFTVASAKFNQYWPRISEMEKLFDSNACQPNNILIQFEYISLCTSRRKENQKITYFHFTKKVNLKVYLQYIMGITSNPYH